MSVLTRALAAVGFKSQTVRQLLPTVPDGWQPQGAMADSGEPISESNVLALSAVWACTNLIAGTIASLPLMVYRQRGDRREVERTHSLYRVLHDSPNADQTAVDFWEFIGASLELWGNGFADIERGADGRVISLIPVNPALMTVRRLGSGRIEYRWTDSGVQQVRMDDRVLHIRGFGGNPLGGMSTLHFGRHAFGIARAVDRAAGATFANGMRPSMSIGVSEWLSAEKRAQVRDVIARDFAGAMNTGRPFIAEGGMKLDPLTINPEDAQMLESRRFSVEEVCRFFGVPPHMVGHTEKTTSWGTGLEQQTMAFQKFTLRRRLKRIEQALMKQLVSPAERSRGVAIEFNLEGLLRGDSASRASFYQSGLTNGWLTINEVRALENKPPVSGGNVPRMQMQNVPITEAGNDLDA